MNNIKESVKYIGDIQTATKKVLPELEDLNINPTTEIQQFKSQNYYGYDNVTCNAVNLQNKNVNPTLQSQTITADNDYVGLSEVIVNSPSLQSKEVNPTNQSQIITADEGYVGLSQVTINAPSLQSKEVNPILQSQTITADEGYVGLSQVTINQPTLQNKEVTPTTSTQTITADNNYIGLSSVQVNAVTSAIDNNIQASNIKNGVNILGVTGTYKGEKFVPSFLSFYYFRGDSLANEISKLDTSNITDMRSMFEYCEYVTELDLSSFDTSNVTSMQYLFYKNVRLQKVDLSSFDTRNVTTMFRLFRDCWGLQELKFGANWLTPDVTEDFSNIGGTWTNQETGVSYSGVNALIEAGKTAGALTGTWKRS